MAEPSSVAVAACAVTGAACVPILTAMGLDPISAVGGFVGTVIAQTLLPVPEGAPPRTIKSVIPLTIGSVLMASVLTPGVAPSAIRYLSDSGIPPHAIWGVCGAGLGALAQPLAVLIFTKAIPFVINLWTSTRGGTKQ